MEDIESNPDIIEADLDITPVMSTDYQIEVDESKDKVGELPMNKNKNKYVTHNYSENPNSPIIFEKLTDSVTSLDKMPKDERSSIDIKSESNIIKDFTIIAYSPGNKFIAGWCNDDGILAVWSLVNDNGNNDGNVSDSRPMFIEKTSFNKSNTQDSEIFLSVSEDGNFVAISRMKIISVTDTESPDMDSERNLGLNMPEETVKLMSTPQTSFTVYSTSPNSPRNYTGLIDLETIEILGPLIFIHDSRFVIFTRHNLYIFSTILGIPIYSVYLGLLIKSVPGYNHDDNLFLIDCYKLLSTSLKTGLGYMLWQEKDGLSVWDLNGVLKQWFYVDPKNSSPKDSLNAISESGELVARLEIDTPKTVFFIAFLSKRDHIVVCSTNGDNVRVQLWACWSGKLIKEDDHPYIDKDQPLIFADDQFVHATGNKIVKYPLFPDKTEKNYRITIKQLSCGQQCSPVSKRFDLDSLLDSSLGHPVCSILIHKKEKVYCRFKFEPWRKWISPNLFMQWLDEDGNRFLLAGNDSIQIYKTKPKGQILKVELQYIWTVPYYKEADIKYMSLEILEPLQDDVNDDHEPSYRLKVQLTNSETIIISLPKANDKFTYQILIDACMSANLMRLLFGEDPSYVSRFDIHAQLKKLIQNSIDKFPSAFNKISLGDGQYIYPMEDFILFEWDDIVKAILNNEKYIPLFHNDEQTESALALLIELQKSDLLDQLISYIIRHVRDRYTPPNSNHSNSRPSSVISVQDISIARIQQPGFAWTVGAALLDLYRYYPDKGSKILREWSHLTTSLETPTRILRTNLGNPLKTEERSFHPELKTVSRNAHLPKEISVHQSIWKLIVSKLFCNIFHKRNDTIISTTTTTTATFAPSDRFNAGSSVFTINVISDDKKDFQQIHVHRKRQRRQRLSTVQKSHPAKLCVVPLPDFCVYPAPPEINKNASIQEYIKKLWATYVSPKRLSPYAEAAIHGPLEMFSEVSMEAIIKFKW
ncbi:4949_t:CDS:2 [Racocetra fulgida]|uniref:4949_t:CDS:1 n=1 Tax=Racocetra fulgida TaxID=60492 RepID=A0A9N9DGK2_9GLOM|nr:4949_t:CDS:2 [Racocetra fulgida]